MAVGQRQRERERETSRYIDAYRKGCCPKQARAERSLVSDHGKASRVTPTSEAETEQPGIVGVRGAAEQSVSSCLAAPTTSGRMLPREIR